MNSCESRRQKNLAERSHFVASSVSPSISPLAARMFYLEWTGFSSDRGEDGHSLATTEHFLASNFKADCCCCCSSDVSQLLSNLQHKVVRADRKCGKTSQLPVAELYGTFQANTIRCHNLKACPGS